MKDNKPENPKAFPNTDGKSFCEDGMSLRDYFAAKALPEIMRQYNGVEKEVYDFDSEAIENIAGYSYEIADAMLKQRNQ